MVYISPSAISLSAKYGIPAAIPINDAVRYPDCVAHEAILIDVSPDGVHATYKGVCPVGHKYQRKMEVAELKRKTRVVIENGQMVNKYEEKVKSADLEEY